MPGRPRERSCDADGMTPFCSRIRHDAAPAALRRSTENRAPAIPWTEARATSCRQVSWLAGRSVGARTFPDARSSGRPPCREPYAPRSPLTVAGTAVDLGLFLPHHIPVFSPSKGTGASHGRALKAPASAPLWQSPPAAKSVHERSIPCASTASDRASTTIGSPASRARCAASRVGADRVTSSGHPASTAFSTSS